MASGAIIVELHGNGGDPINYTVDDTQAILKGDLLQVVDARKCSGSIGAAIMQGAGVAAADKVVSDGSTTLAVYQKGIYRRKE